jgi:hypothetical protein
MMRDILAACVTIGFFSVATVSYGQEAVEPEIVVTGVRAERLQAFVEQVSAPSPAADQIARWDDDICMSVLGLDQEQGQFVVDRISYRAEGVGLAAGGVGCRPNVFVFFAADADTFARRLVDERKSLFAYYHEEHVVTRGREALEDFAQTSRPVRWWHVAQTRGADGDRLGSDNAGSRGPPPPEGDVLRADPDGITGAQAVRSNGSRVRAAERQDFNRVVIVVDGQRAAGYSLDAISDYVAMVALAQIDPNASVSDYPSILNLFAAPPDDAPTEMSDWDRAYLNGLYRSTRNAASVSQQVRDIARRMAGESRSGS